MSELSDVNLQRQIDDLRNEIARMQRRLRELERQREGWSGQPVSWRTVAEDMRGAW